MPPSIKLVIFDFDGTLFDTQDSIAHTFAITLVHLLPSRRRVPLRDLRQPLPPHHHPPAPSRLPRCARRGVLGAISLCVPLAVPDARRSVYRTFPPHSGAAEAVARVEDPLRYCALLCAIVSNKAIAAAREVLAAQVLSSLIELVVGDDEPVDCPQKPDPGSWIKVAKPVFQQDTAMRAGLGDLQGGDVLVVGETEADIKYAQNIGAKSVWCSHGYGTRKRCMDLKPDFVVKGLDKVMALLQPDRE